MCNYDRYHVQRNRLSALGRALVTHLSFLQSRTYQNYFMGSRLDQYRDLLRQIRAAGYCFSTTSGFAQSISSSDGVRPATCLLRIDVDTDPAGAARMFDCDREFDVRATYYFRLSTIDRRLMRRICEFGSEVGYHCEETSTIIKRHGLASRQQIDSHVDVMRAEFRKNIANFRDLSGIMPRSVVAHGDFINRLVNVPDSYFITPSLLKEFEIAADTPKTCRWFSDAPAPIWWRPQNPLDAISGAPNTMAILVHPRQWTCNRMANLRLDFVRVWEEAAWRTKRIVASTSSPIRASD
jgi:hypothetical protein